jgi:hypothetical protein
VPLTIFLDSSPGHAAVGVLDRITGTGVLPILLIIVTSATAPLADSPRVSRKLVKMALRGLTRAVAAYAGFSRKYYGFILVFAFVAGMGEVLGLIGGHATWLALVYLMVLVALARNALSVRRSWRMQRASARE